MNLLKNRNYLLLRSAWSLSSFGTKIQSFAFSLYVLAVTGSALQFSAALGVQMLPYILFAPFSGYAADRYNRKLQVILCDALSAAAVLSLLGCFLAEKRLSVSLIYAGVFLLSGIDSFFNAAASGLIQSAVAPADVLNQKSVDTTLSSLLSILTPAAAGTLYAFFGLGPVLAANALSFLLSAGLESRIRQPSLCRSDSAEKPAAFLCAVREGLRYTRGNPFIRSFLLVLSALNFILPGVEIAFMTVSQQLLRLNPAVIGALNSVISAGALGGALLCALLGRRVERAPFRAIVTADLLATGAAFLLLGVWAGALRDILLPFGSLLLFTLLNFAVVAANGFLSVNLSARFQRAVPNDIMGRTGSFVNAALLVSTPLGQVFSGFLLGRFPAFAAYLSECLLCAALFLFSAGRGRKYGIIAANQTAAEPNGPGVKKRRLPLEQTETDQAGGN